MANNSTVALRAADHRRAHGRVVRAEARHLEAADRLRNFSEGLNEALEAQASEDKIGILQDAKRRARGWLAETEQELRAAKAALTDRALALSAAQREEAKASARREEEALRGLLEARGIAPGKAREAACRLPRRTAEAKASAVTTMVVVEKVALRTEGLMAKFGRRAGK